LARSVRQSRTRIRILGHSQHDISSTAGSETTTNRRLVRTTKTHVEESFRTLCSKVTFSCTRSRSARVAYASSAALVSRQTRYVPSSSLPSMKSPKPKRIASFLNRCNLCKNRGHGKIRPSGRRARATLSKSSTHRKRTEQEQNLVCRQHLRLSMWRDHYIASWLLAKLTSLPPEPRPLPPSQHAS
jgi:hypothetical protein